MKPWPRLDAEDPTGHILIVDDNPDAVETLALALRGAAQQVETAYDGVQAVEAAQRAQPSLVLLDIGLPGMDGYRVARALRELESRTGDRIRIVAVTGYGDAESQRRSAAAGFDAHLIKPVNLGAIYELLQARE